MKKVLMMIALIAAPALFVSCDNDDDWYYQPKPNGGWNNGGGNGGSNSNYDSQLNSYEQGLVGSYVSDDDGDVVYIVLNNDRSGSIASNNSTSSFTWRATGSKFIVIYDGDYDETSMDYYYKDNHLYIDGIALVSNNGGGSTTTTTTKPLIGQWQGSITNYYLAMYPNLDENGQYATILEFTNDGYGAQLDYEESNPRDNYSYMPFQWMSNGTAIILYYGEDIPTATISNYALTSAKFTGQVAYGLESYAFKYDKTTGFDWSPYQKAKAVGGKTVASAILKELMADKAKMTATGKFKK